MSSHSITECADARCPEHVEPEVTHLCPPKGSGLLPCCGRTPFEVPAWHRMTLNHDYVTCAAAGDDDGR